MYLQVGVGSFTNTYINGGQPGNNTTINTVSATVPAAVVGNGTAQAMTTNSTATLSYWDGYAYCSVPGQLYIGGFYRTTGGHHRRGAGHGHRARGIDQRHGRHHSVLKDPVDLERQRRHRRRAFSRRHLRQRRRAERRLHGQQHLERELLDVLLFEQHRAARPAPSPASFSTR